MNFDKNIFSKGKSLFTQDEFNKALTEAKAEIMAIAIQTTKQAIAIEREECAKIADAHGAYEGAGELIRNRMKA
jgi:hypothetical protein